MEQSIVFRLSQIQVSDLESLQLKLDCQKILA